MSSSNPLDDIPIIESSNIPPVTKLPSDVPLIVQTPNINSSEDISFNNKETQTPDSESSINNTITQTANTLKSINSIKDELCKLPLDDCETQYITNRILPLLTVLYELSASSLSLSSSSNFLTNSPLVHPKKSEIKDTIHLIYNINDECEDIFKVIKKRLKLLLKDP